MDPHGISLGSGKGNVHIPRGTVIAAPVDPIHRDNDIYPDAHRFNPYRFIQPDNVRSIFSVINPDEKQDGHQDQDSAHPGKQKSATTLDEAFLGFGFGKYACPGRFFALNEMKIFVAHMVMNYEIECLGPRPELTNVVWLKVPYHDARVRVRKRSTANREPDRE